MSDEGRPESLGDFLRQQRERAGLSQRELARRADMDHAHLNRIESGKYASAPPEHLQRLADALEIDVSDLLAFFGVKPSMPDTRTYFRRKLGVDAKEADILAGLIEDHQAKKKGEQA